MRILLAGLLICVLNLKAVHGQDTNDCSPILRDVIAGQNIIININCNNALSAQDRKEISSCLVASREISDSCRAYDKSGFHSSPSDRCAMNLVAPSGYFFPHREVFVTQEQYRNISGLPAQLALKSEKALYEDKNLIIKFNGEIGCTNAVGTGRTCESKATIKGIAYPLSCSKYIDRIDQAAWDSVNN